MTQLRALALFSVLLLGIALPASAGNIGLTGHDDDFHQSTEALAQASGLVNFARSGAPNASLPVLSFDAGSELTSLLTTIGVPFTNINPNTGVPAASNFDVTKFSAIVVASDSTCGGCDNSATSSTNLAGAKTAIASFFNSGGGIATFAAASNANYFDFLPATASVPGIVTCSDCFTQTAAGVAAGVPAVNGDFPHNFFPFPGSGLDPLFVAFETYTGPGSDASGNALELVNQPFTVGIAGATIVDGGFGPGAGTVPEPGTLLLLGTTFAGLVPVIRRRLL